MRLSLQNVVLDLYHQRGFALDVSDENGQLLISQLLYHFLNVFTLGTVEQGVIHIYQTNHPLRDEHVQVGDILIDGRDR